MAGRWIRKVEKTMIQIKIPHDLRVDCATQLLSNGAMTWWETVQVRRATETDTTKRLMSSPKCRSVEVINNPVRPGSNHREVNCINYRQQQQQQ